ncbi:MAG: aldo/keto reductase, partial [bacterium]
MVPLIIGGVLNSGILATGAIPAAKYNYQTASPDILTKVGALDAASRAARTTLLSAALRFPLTSRTVASVLIGAATPASLTANLTAAQTPVPP